ncbi:hypothetical protein OPKNFCMD_3365 [Methylobacterium crusticola]|uniref:GSCFA domain-containing protein n=2 Tax=Methylobacterium crusticola TaxID=1697972 RepID=A0ABQ4QYZ4_9HYPH|nr:GSCFA domain-containing protein [Methylobacterium crusticola]GJD50622.1 hypothetical protein OPKNFCMD_3365 [Methylobacterium crusticola]
MSHPYRRLRDRAFWSRSVAGVAPAAIDPVGRFDLRIGPGDRVATAGSCFAQHIARHLDRAGFTHHVTEPAHPILARRVARERQYGLFSARYGNIYTARQLHQLVARAYGRFRPAEDVWIEADGRVLDPFRPTIEPGGFASEAEMRADRRQHLAAVRGMLETLDVLVFTLGLTECWHAAADGAVFPVCPGVSGGTFDRSRHRFHNLSVAEVAADLRAVVTDLAAVNPRAQVVLTVSPVPLVATARPDAHVLSATAYSKAVLRVAAEEAAQLPRVHYFPAYEIVTGPHARYFAPDLRSVTEAGVAHVMRLFLKHAARPEAAPGAGAPDAAPARAAEPGRGSGTRPVAAPASLADDGEALVAVMCDEERLARP